MNENDARQHGQLELLLCRRRRGGSRAVLLAQPIPVKPTAVDRMSHRGRVESAVGTGQHLPSLISPQRHPRKLGQPLCIVLFYRCALLEEGPEIFEHLSRVLDSAHQRFVSSVQAGFLSVAPKGVAECSRRCHVA